MDSCSDSEVLGGGAGELGFLQWVVAVSSVTGAGEVAWQWLQVSSSSWSREVSGGGRFWKGLTF